MNDPTNPVGGEALPDGEAFGAPEVDEAYGLDHPSGEGPVSGEPSDEMAEIEFDGRRWQVPAPLKAGFMMHADYTRKTQDLAEQRRALEAERTAAEADPGWSEDVARVHALDEALAQYGQVDWAGWHAADPHGAAQAWAQAEQLFAARDHAAHHAEQRAHAAVLEAEGERAWRLEQAEAELARDIEGWSDGLREQLTAYGRAKGFTAEELGEVDDPRAVKVLHLAMIGEQALNERAGARSFARTRPPTQLGGGGYAGSQPSDRQSAEAWMQARQAQLRKKARG
ncbi:MAG TPA: hypothetical protein VEA15_07915 [Caulobacteraceae bacterium]|nr:hypothetical protein [Caulobacteraceae bacterium]